MINGIINIYKESGFTSHDVVAKMRGILKQKKIGHTGTLDPDAVGVLPVCLGSGTKLCDMLTDKSKEYEAKMQLGITTDTQDISGTVLTRSEVNVTEAEVTEAVQNFIGEYDQVPPMYSAIKVNGKKLYELAREGKEIERKARRVCIQDIQILEISLPYVRLKVNCSKGTYIRTLCQDIGEKLDCGATMTELTRTRVGQFGIEEAVTLSELERLRDNGTLEEHIVPVDAVFADLREVTLQDKFLKLIDNGNAFYPNQIMEQGNGIGANDSKADGAGYTGTDWQDREQVRVYGAAHKFYGIYAYDVTEGRFRPVKMFPEN